MRLFVSALEYSANIHLKYLLREMVKSENIELCGIFDEGIISELKRECGESKNALKGTALCNISEVGVMGFIDVLKKAKFFLQLRAKCLNLALSADKILLMDSSSFNIPLAKRVKKRDSSKEIMYYILPQVWAWKPWRAKVIEANCDKLAAILPFEVECYEKKAKFVGHPLLDEIQQFRGGNLFWGMQFAPFSHKTALDERSSSISLVSRKNGAKPHRHYFDCRFVQGTNLTKKSNQKSLLKFLLLFAFAKSRVSLLSRHCEANRRFAEAIQNINESRDSATESRPIRGAKNRIQTSSSASADFLLESDKRGSPPKSEKRQLLARRGSGVGGAALLQKETNSKDSIDLKVDLIAESHKKIDSRFALDSRDLDSSLRATRYAQNDEFLDCHESADADSRNDDIFLDSSPTAQNDKSSVDCFGQSHRNDDSFIDCHDLPKANLAMTSNSDIFTFMPGSRLSEINRIFPIFLQVKDTLKKRDSKAKFHLVVPKKFKGKNLSEIYGDLNDFHITFDAHTSLLQSTFAFICSGTATLECALIGTPFVLGYKCRALEAFIAKRFLHIRFVGLANLLYSHIAPNARFHDELLQENLNAQNLLDSYHNANPNDFLEKSLALRAYLKSGASRAVTKWLLEK